MGAKRSIRVHFSAPSKVSPTPITLLSPARNIYVAIRSRCAPCVNRNSRGSMYNSIRGANSFKIPSSIICLSGERQRSGAPTPCGGYPATPCSAFIILCPILISVFMSGIRRNACVFLNSHPKYEECHDSMYKLDQICRYHR